MDETHDQDDRLSPRPHAEGVRIIRAEEAQAALEAGQAEGRMPDDAPRFGDVPPPPTGPRSAHRFPLPDSVDPASAVPRPNVKAPERRFGSRFTGRGKSQEVVRAPSPPRVVRLVPASDSETPPARATEQWPSESAAAETGWGTESWSDETAARRGGDEPLSVGASTDGGRHFAKMDRDPLGATAQWSPSSSAGEGYPSSVSASNLDPPQAPVPHEGRGSHEPPAPDLSPPEEGINVHTGAQPELPHWTDPPTGEVPFILPDREPSQGEEMAAWQALGSRGLRWRDEASDWDDVDDVSHLAEDDETRLGALDTNRTEHSDVYSFDEQFERLEDERSGAVPIADPVLDVPPVATPPQRRAGARPQPGLRGSRSARRSPSSSPNAIPSSRPPAGGGRDLQTATIVGVGMIVALFIAYYLGAAVLVLLATVIVTASALELYNLIQHRGFRPANLLGVCATVAVMLASYWRGSVAVPLILALVFITSMLWYMLKVVDARPVVNVGLTVMTFIWVGVFGSYASLLLRGHRGKQLLLLPVLVTVAADTVAYFAGSSIGNRPLAPSISPGKTWEGAIAGGVGAIVVSFVLSRLGFLSKTWSGKDALLLGLVVAIVAPLGDLCESMVKRDLDLKDSGSVLPGHGGLMDRFDALLFVLPAAYYLVLYLKLI